MPEAAQRFLDAIDGRHDAADSVVLRYRHALRFADDDANNAALTTLVKSTSIREGLRVVPFGRHAGVEIDLLDETSLMHTKTFKSIDGCITTAHCLRNGYRRIAFESGGNTGTALTAYGTHAGLETFCFVPTGNLPLLDSATFARPGAHLIAVDDPGLVKATAAEAIAHQGLMRVPLLVWRYQAATCIGSFVLEHLLAHDPYDYIVQSISAAFGPIGIYRVLLRHHADLERVPAFLGVQQAANCPMVRAWKAHSGSAQPGNGDSTLLTRVMYDREPQTYGTFNELRDILIASHGDLTAVGDDEFRSRLHLDRGGASVLQRLTDCGIDIAQRDGEIVEKTGLVALAGLLKEIASGGIRPRSRVLLCLTGGAGRPDGRARPEPWSPAATVATTAAHGA